MKKENELISIIIPVYNVKTIIATVKSIPVSPLLFEIIFFILSVSFLPRGAK